MRDPDSFLSQPIRSLQTMLQVLHAQDGSNMEVIPDGIYGSQTMRAISNFQRMHGIPVTGITDQVTWDMIVPCYEHALTEVIQAAPLEINMDTNLVYSMNDENPNIYILQAVLKVLSLAYSCLDAPQLTGKMDLATSEALSSFQTLCGIPATGRLDKSTWKLLANYYPMAASACHNPREPVTSKEY